MAAVLIFLSFLIATVGPHLIYYQASPLSELGLTGIKSTALAFVFCLVTALFKLLFFATLLFIEDVVHIPYIRELCSLLVSQADVIGLYLCYTYVIDKQMRNQKKVYAVNIGWSLCITLFYVIIPAFIQFIRYEYSLEHVFAAINNNVTLVYLYNPCFIAMLLYCRRQKSVSHQNMLTGCIAMLFLVAQAIKVMQERGLSGWQGVLFQVAAAGIAYTASKAAGSAVGYTQNVI